MLFSPTDSSPDAIAEVKNLARKIAPHLPADNFQVGLAETLPLFV